MSAHDEDLVVLVGIPANQLATETLEPVWVDRSAHRAEAIQLVLPDGNYVMVRWDELQATGEFQARDDGVLAQVLRYNGVPW